jgi:hypothetical protein
MRLRLLKRQRHTLHALDEMLVHERLTALADLDRLAGRTRPGDAKDGGERAERSVQVDGVFHKIHSL